MGSGSGFEESQVFEEPGFVGELMLEAESDFEGKVVSVSGGAALPETRSEAGSGTGKGLSGSLLGSRIPAAVSASIWGKVRSIRLLT